MRLGEIDLGKPFPFTYPWYLWPAVALAFPVMWLVTVFMQAYFGEKEQL